MRYITIIDIAEQLGLSKSTVSRALRDSSNIKKETKQKVIALAEKLGYKPNNIAINLRQRQTMIIGIIVPEMITTFFITVINVIQEILIKKGYKVIITQSQENAEIELNNLRLLEDYRVEGIIMSICHLKKNEEEYLRLQRNGINIVFFDRVPHIEAPKVVINDYKTSFFLVEHLIHSGSKQIIHLAGPDYLQNAIDRKKGYRDALQKFKIAYDPKLVIDAGISIESGEKTLSNLVEQHKIEFDAIFCFTDTLAIGAKKYLQAHNYRIPEDVALAGFSGSLLSTLVEPQLTTVEQPLEEMAEASVRLLLEKIDNPLIENKTIVLNAEIKLRASTLKV